MAKRAAIYSRVSTSDQKVDLQRDELTEYAERRGFDIVAEFIEEGVSGKAKRLPEREKLLELARKRKIDVILCWKLDRLGRSTLDLSKIAVECGEIGVDLVFYTQGFDTTTPMGKAFFHISAAFAELESEMISERVKGGMAAAKKRGKHLGRPKPKEEKIARAKELQAGGLSYRDIAKQLKVDPATVHRYCRA